MSASPQRVAGQAGPGFYRAPKDYIRAWLLLASAFTLPGRAAPGSNGGYWEPKLVRNVERDAKAHAALTNGGWDVLVIWECETKDLAILEKRLRDFLEPDIPKRGQSELMQEE